MTPPGGPTFEIGAAAPADYPALAALCDEAFGDAAPGYFLARLAGDSRLLPGGALVARAEGRTVASVTMFALTMRYGAAAIPLGGVAHVCTLPAFRRRGAASLLLEAALAEMRRRGWPLSALSTGIPAFYAPFGYLPWRRVERRFLGILPPAAAPGGVRPLDPAGDLAELARLHAIAGRRILGVLDRSPEIWERHWTWTALHPRERRELALAAPATGGLRAYVRGSFDAGTGWARVTEFAAEEEAGREVAVLAAALAAAAAALGARGLAVPDAADQLGRALEPFARAAARETDDSMLLGVLDPAGFLATAAPELSARARAAGARAGAVLLDDGARRTVLRLDAAEVTASPAGPADGALPVARLDPARWVEVWFGGRPFGAQPFAARSRLGEREINLLDALFPPRPAGFWEADAF